MPRISIDLADIIFRLECAKCGTAVTIKPAEWSELLDHYPNCKAGWPLRMPEAPLRYLKALLENYATDKLPFRLKFEIEQPRT